MFLQYSQLSINYRKALKAFLGLAKKDVVSWSPLRRGGSSGIVVAFYRNSRKDSVGNATIYDHDAEAMEYVRWKDIA